MNRLKELRVEKGLTQEQLAKQFHTGKSTIGMWENNKREPDYETLLNLAEYFGVTIDYILGNSDYRDLDNLVSTLYPEWKKGENYLPSKEYQKPEDINLLNKYHSLDKHGKKIVDLVLDEECERCSTGIDLDDAALIMINYIDAPVSAGLGDILNDYEDTRKVSVPLTKESRKADFILKVDGDSMEPEFRSGDYVLVRQQPAIDEGQIGIFDVDGKGYIKKLGQNRLISLNPDYSDIVLNEYTDFRCFGLVLGTTDIVDI